MPEFVKFISPERAGYMPMQELVPDTQRGVYEVLANVMERLPETSEPQLLRPLIRLDDDREVAPTILRNCNTTQEYYDWERENVNYTILKLGNWLILGMNGLARVHGRGLDSPEEDKREK